MKIRFFNTVEPGTTFFRDLVPFLAEEGHHVEVVLSGTEYRAERSSLQEALYHENVLVTYLRPYGQQVPADSKRKLLLMLSYIGQSALYSIRSKADVNFFLTQPPLFFLWGRVIRLFRREPYVCLIMDLYPDVAVKGGVLLKHSFLTRILHYLSRYGLRKADRVVTIGRCTAELLQNDGIESERIHNIPNWTNEHLIRPIPKENNRLRREWGFTPEDFIVLYSGNMGVSHDFDTLLEVIEQIQEQDKNVHFVFIGDGGRKLQIEDADQKFPNIHLFPFQPLEKLSESLSIADVHFVSLRPGFEGLVVPSKAYGALASGRPMIYEGRSNGEIARMISEHDVGQVVQPGDVEGLHRTVIKYAKNPEVVFEQGRRAREIAVNDFGKDRALFQYKKLFESLQKKRINSQ